MTDFEKIAEQCVSSNGLSPKDPILKGMSKKDRKRFLDDVAAGIREARRALTPEENMTGFIEAMRANEHRIVLVDGAPAHLLSAESSDDAWSRAHFSLTVTMNDPTGCNNLIDKISQKDCVLSSWDGRHHVRAIVIRIDMDNGFSNNVVATFAVAGGLSNG